MATRRTSASPPGLTIPVIIGGFVFAAVATWLRVPGAVFLWFMCAVAAWMRPRPEMSGKDTKTRAPIPAHEGEEQAMRSYNLSRDIRWRLFVPTLDLLPGWPVLWTWIVALTAGLATWWLVPVRLPVMAVMNGVALFWLIAQTGASRRRFSRQGLDCPGVRVNALPAAGRRYGPLMWVGGGFAAALTGVGTYMLVSLLPHKLPLLPTIGAVALAGVGGALLAWWRPMSNTALKEWRELQEARAMYTGLWENLKKHGTPMLLDREYVGPATVDTFRCSPGIQAGTVITGTEAIAGELGTGLDVVILPRPNLDPSGQPMVGTMHPTEFDIVSWPTDQRFDFTVENEDADLALLAARFAFAQWANDMKAEIPTVAAATMIGRPAPPPTFDDAPPPPPPPLPLPPPPPVPPRLVPRGTDPEGETVEDDAAEDTFGRVENPYEGINDDGIPSEMGGFDAADFVTESVFGEAAPPDDAETPVSLRVPLRERLAGAGAFIKRVLRGFGSFAKRLIGFFRTGAPQPSEEPGGPAMWRIDVVSGFSMSDVRFSSIGSLGGYLGSRVLIQHRGVSRRLPETGIFIGDFENCEDLDFEQASASAYATMFEDLADEDELRYKWQQALKQGMPAPLPQYDPSVNEWASLPNGTELHRQAYLVMSGMDADTYVPFEKNLASALGMPGLCAITGWIDQGVGRQGERSSRAFTLITATGPVPATPMDLAAPPTGQNKACSWALAAMMNRAFDANRIKRPEVLSALPLTEPSSRQHIWRITLRLLGGATLADIRKASASIASSLGVPWLRVEPNPDGCIIIAGGLPHLRTVQLRQPEVNQAYVTRLNWEHAFLASGVSGNGGLLPKLVAVDHEPENTDVEILDFELPDGLDVKSVRAVAKDKLRPATNNEFVEIRAGVSGAKSMRVLACEKDPMPTMAPYRFDYPAQPYAPIPLGTLPSGQTETVDFKKDPHLVIVGGAGGGKSAAAQAIMFGALKTGGQVVVVDVQKQAADFRFAADYCASVCTTLAEARSALEALYEEVKRRAKLNAAHGAGSSRDLPDPPPSIYLFIDEFMGLITASRPSTVKEIDPDLEAARLEQQADYEAKRRIAFLTGRVAAEARSADVHLVLMTQKLQSKTLPPELSDLRTNAARIILGKASYGDLMAALREPDAAPDRGDTIPKGRALWESTEAQPVQVQFWFATQPEFGAGLKALDLPAPMMLDVEAFKPRVQAPGGFTILDEATSQAADGEIEGPEIVVDLGNLDLDLGDLGDLGDLDLGSESDSELGLLDFAVIGEEAVVEPPTEPQEGYEATQDPETGPEAAQSAPEALEPPQEPQSVSEAPQPPSAAPQAAQLPPPPPARPHVPRRHTASGDRAPLTLSQRLLHDPETPSTPEPGDGTEADGETEPASDFNWMY